jgi:hypothetical protein
VGGVGCGEDVDVQDEEDETIFSAIEGEGEGVETDINILQGIDWKSCGTCNLTMLLL